MATLFSLEGSIILTAVAAAIAFFMHYHEDDVADFIINLLNRK